MDKLISDTLVQLGLSHKETVFMLACYELGETSLSAIAKKARLERSTTYLIAQELTEKGFLKQNLTRYRKNIVAIEPKTLLRMLAAKQRTIRRQEMELEEKLPELQAYYKTSKIQPSVKVFQGNSALHTIWEDVLTAEKEILLWTNQQTESKFFSKEFHEKFIQERVRKKIPIRVLAVNNVPGKKLLETDTASLRHSKLLPIHVSFSAETYLYDNKVAILDYKKDIIGIIIESEPIASTQIAIFEMVWNMQKEEVQS